MALSKHIIIEGLPATGKSEINNIFRIYFPARVWIFPELTTTIVRKHLHKINILQERWKMTSLLNKYLKERVQKIRHLQKLYKEKDKDLIIFEESHLGVHWAYSKVIKDQFFLDEYDDHLRAEQIEPDLYIRLYIDPELSYQRQVARVTPDVEVPAKIISKMYEYLKEWHETYSSTKVVEINADRSPDEVIKDVLKIIDITYKSLI